MNQTGEGLWPLVEHRSITALPLIDNFVLWLTVTGLRDKLCCIRENVGWYNSQIFPVAPNQTCATVRRNFGPFLPTKLLWFINLSGSFSVITPPQVIICHSISIGLKTWRVAIVLNVLYLKYVWETICLTVGWWTLRFDKFCVLFQVHGSLQFLL